MKKKVEVRQVPLFRNKSEKPPQLPAEQKAFHKLLQRLEKAKNALTGKRYKVQYTCDAFSARLELNFEAMPNYVVYEESGNGAKSIQLKDVIESAECGVSTIDAHITNENIRGVGKMIVRDIDTDICLDDEKEVYQYLYENDAIFQKNVDVLVGLYHEIFSYINKMEKDGMVPDWDEINMY